jgi:hypothetical protein
MEDIKLFADGLLSMGCMTRLYTCLYDIFEVLIEEGSSMGCTCPFEGNQ